MNDSNWLKAPGPENYISRLQAEARGVSKAMGPLLREERWSEDTHISDLG